MSYGKGYDGLCSHMILNCLTRKVKECLFLFFQYILRHAAITTDFNVSIIRPKIKDHGKSSVDVENLRPISVSNTLYQIIERIFMNNRVQSTKSYLPNRIL